MLSEISQTQNDKCYRSHLQTESKKVKAIEAESRMVVTSGWGRVRGLGRCFSKRTKFLLDRRNKFKRSIVQIINNNAYRFENC